MTDRLLPVSGRHDDRAAQVQEKRTCAYCAMGFHGKEAGGVTDKCDCDCHARPAGMVPLCRVCDQRVARTNRGWWWCATCQKRRRVIVWGELLEKEWVERGR